MTASKGNKNAAFIKCVLGNPDIVGKYEDFHDRKTKENHTNLQEQWCKLSVRRRQNSECKRRRCG